MLYYYLDGLDKKGPYNPDELKSRNLTSDTLVFSEGMANWKSIKEIPELNVLLFEVKEENTIDKEVQEIETNTESEPESQQLNLKKSILQKKETKKIKIPVIIFLILGINVSIGLSYLIVKGQKTKDKNEITKKIDELFQGKDEICDFQKTGVFGTLQRVTVGPDDFLGDKWISVKVGNRELAHKPDIPNESNGGENNIFYQNELQKWQSCKDLVEYYQCNSGGFKILTLIKLNNGFNLIESTSQDLGYKISESRYIPGTNYGYGLSTPGYTLSNFRPTVQACYDAAMEYLTKEKENKSYVAGSYDKIKTFDEIKTDFYYIDNISSIKYIKNSIYEKSWSGTGTAVYNSQYIVWYDTNGKHYEIVEYTKLFNKRWAEYSGIGSLIAILIYFLIRYRRKITLQVS